MGKIDDLRRQREEQHARQELASEAAAKTAARAAPAPKPEPVATAPAAAPAPAPAPAPRKGAKDDAEIKGKCPACGKLREVTNGLIASHQKGLGKVCPGSRKEPG